ncbi:dicarboxylate/amino acid:cation symporter [Gallicola sp. Sow4_E12]|uniref:dicarboxylate/amino acid:cation symporter n=1 Tax=Gallicola sp. Sow4_E12 TaxID=3438785 RepID=UPI003F904C97
MEKKERKKLSLTTRIFIALIVGAVVGIIIRYLIPAGYIRDDIVVNGIFTVLGQGFIRLMQMLVVPLVFFSLVTGAMSIGDTEKLGRVGVKTVAFYICTTALAVAIALTVANIVRPGVGMGMSVQDPGAVMQGAEETPSIVDMLLGIIPTNPIQALAEGNMLQLILFALVVGVLLANMGGRGERLQVLCAEGNDLMMDMTLAVMKFAPIGIFCLIAKTFSEIGFEAFAPMLKYIFSVVLALILQLLIVYMVMLFIFARVNPFKFLKNFAPVMGFAFSTASSNATIPTSINTLEKLGVSKKISSFTVPLGATINMDGTAIMQGVAVVFVAFAYGIDLSLADFATVILTATLASVGTAGIPSVGLITLSMVFTSVGLPVEGIAMIMGIDRILDMSRTAVNVTGDATVTVIMAKQEGEEMFNKERYNAVVESE